MNDLISRQAAIDALHMHLMYRMGTDSNKKRLDEWINNLPSAQPEQQWIPCSERLPEEGHDVLITKESFKIKGYEQEVIKAKRSADPRSGKIEWWSEFGTLTNKAVLAWMPLPEPWKGE